MMMLSILAKSLVRFKPVSNLNFMKIHSHQRPSSSVHSHFLKCPVLGIDPSKNLPIKDLESPEIFFDSYNGLVCMARPSRTKQVVLWNPATNFWKYLPHSHYSSDFGLHPEMASLGFGCSDGDDFKVVRIFPLDIHMRSVAVGVEVYSSLSDCWRTVEVGFNFRLLHAKSCALVNGNPYWMVYLDGDGDGNEDRLALLGFDATEMAFNKIVPFPNITGVMGKPLKATCVDWEGSLAVIVCDTKDFDWLEWIHVWLYDDVHNYWRMEKFGPINMQVEFILHYSKSGKIIGGSSDQKLFTYDSKKEKDCVLVSEFKKPNDCSLQVFSYEESSAFVQGMVPAVAKVNNKENCHKFNEIDGFFVATLKHITGEIACHYVLGSSCSTEDCSPLRVEIDGIIE